MPRLTPYNPVGNESAHTERTGESENKTQMGVCAGRIPFLSLVSPQLSPCTLPHLTPCDPAGNASAHSERTGEGEARHKKAAREQDSKWAIW